MEAKPETKHFNFVFPVALVEALKAKAKEQGLTHSSLVRMILTNWLAANPVKGGNDGKNTNRL